MGCAAPRRPAYRSEVGSQAPRPIRTVFSTHVVARRDATDAEVFAELLELRFFFEVRTYQAGQEWVIVGPVKTEPWLDQLLFHLQRLEPPIESGAARNPVNRNGSMPPLRKTWE